MRDASGETPLPAAESAYIILASDEPLAANPSGGPAGAFFIESVSGAQGSAEISFADTTGAALSIRLNIAAGQTYRIGFSVPDVHGNTTSGDITFTTRAPAFQVTQPAPVLDAYVDARGLVLQNGYWVPQGNWIQNLPGAQQQGYNPTPYTGGTTAGIPPLVMERVRGPNYTWITRYQYATPCPSCPPVEQVAPQAPVTPPPSLTGIAGTLQRICWELDCGRQVAESLINRGIRGFASSLVRR